MAPLSINLIELCCIACSVGSATEVTLPGPISGSYKYLQYVLFDFNSRHKIKPFQAHITTIMHDLHGRHGLECFSEYGSEDESCYLTVEKVIRIGWRSRFSITLASWLTLAK